MLEKQVFVPTDDGTIDTFICHPERNGPHPAVFFFMDSVGIREELRTMARRLAASGYCVLLPNLYYRSGHGIEPLTQAIAEKANPFPRIVALMGTLSNALVARDTAALLSYLEDEPAAQPDVVGCVGYCMSGQFVLTAAGRFPERIAAAAAFYGTEMITDKPDSPHLLIPAIKARLYLAYAETDSYVPRAAMDALAVTLRDAGKDFESELYPGTQHGFAFPERPEYDRTAADRHWERLIALFQARLGNQPT